MNPPGLESPRRYSSTFEEPDSRVVPTSATAVSARLAWLVLGLFVLRIAFLELRHVVIDTPPSVIPEGRVRVNDAAAFDLQLLPGIGPARAQAIVEERLRSGPFEDARALERVPGIGPRTVEDLAPFLDFVQRAPP